MTKDDLISRQAAIDINAYYHGRMPNEVNYKIYKKLMQLPSAQKTGRWIQFPSHNAYKCSECGRVIETTNGKNNVCKHYPYCHCGAKMEVEHETD